MSFYSSDVIFCAAEEWFFFQSLETEIVLYTETCSEYRMLTLEIINKISWFLVSL